MLSFINSQVHRVIHNHYTMHIALALRVVQRHLLVVERDYFFPMFDHFPGLVCMLLLLFYFSMAIAFNEY